MSKLVTIAKGLASHQTAIGRIDPDDSSMAICSIGIRHHGPIPDSGTTAEVPYSRHRLLHEVGRSRSLGHHHIKERTELRLEEYNL